MNLKIMNYLRNDYALLLEINNSLFNGYLVGRSVETLTSDELQDLNKYNNIVNILNCSGKLLEISYYDDKFILKIINFTHEESSNLNFVVEDYRINDDLLELLNSYNEELSNNEDMAYHKKI